MPYATVLAFERKRGGVLIERNAPLPAMFVCTSDVETADRLVTLLTCERESARRRSADASPPLPVGGFRESSSEVGWRVRVLDAVSDEERNAVIARVAPDEIHGLLDETADPSLEDALREQLRRQR